MTKYKITVEVETYVEPHLLDDSSFKYMFMVDLRSFFDEGADPERFGGVNNNVLALPDGTERYFSTKFRLEEMETDQQEKQVDPADLYLKSLDDLPEWMEKVRQSKL